MDARLENPELYARLEFALIAAMANLADELRREGQQRIAQGLAEDVVWGEVEDDALVMRWPGPGGFEVLRLARGSLAGQELEG